MLHNWLLRAVAGRRRICRYVRHHGPAPPVGMGSGWLPGYEAPSRFGSAMPRHAQLQLDVYGELIDAFISRAWPS